MLSKLHLTSPSELVGALAYIGGFPTYRDKCNEVAAAGYEGFSLTTASG